MDFDIVHPIHLDDGMASTHANAIRTAEVLASGLTHIYSCVKNAEASALARQAVRTEDGVRAFQFGDLSDLAEIPTNLVECMFRWYAVAACDFVRVAVWIAGFDKQVREEYTQIVLGPVQSFRDKIGAHTSGVTVNSRDTEAERLVSTIRQVSWLNDRFRVGVFAVRIQRGNRISDSSSMKPWSLTDFHLQLCDRYPILARMVSATENS